MENEGEVTVVVENQAAVMEAQAEVALAQIEASVEIAEIEAEATVAIAEAKGDDYSELATAVAELRVAREECSAARGEVAVLSAQMAELRALLENAADAVEADLREEIAAELEKSDVVVDAIESGEVPASVESAEAHEPAPVEIAQEHSRKRHFIRL